MPQLDFAFFPSQIFWLLFSFGVLYILSKHLILPRIESIVLSRLTIIEKDIKDAVALNGEAKQLQESLAKKEQETHDYLAKMQADTIAAFASEKEKQIKIINKNSTESIAKALQEIELAVKEANKEMDNYIIAHAKSLITTIAGIQPSTNDLNQSYKKMSKK